MLRTRDQIYADLSAKLDSKHVKARSQSGRTLSYIEGWHAIAEANRIFGFDGWTRETVEMRESRPAEIVSITKRDRNNNEYTVEQWRVGFVARVRITALNVTREGTGWGSGFAADLGDAMESAIKEAETDAMKRALMTFGNPFGLALYDKTQANVADDVAPPAATADDEPFESDGSAVPSHSLKKYAPDAWPQFQTAVRNCSTVTELVDVKRTWRTEIARWPEAWRNTANDICDKHKDDLVAARDAAQ